MMAGIPKIRQIDLHVFHRIWKISSSGWLILLKIRAATFE